MVRLRRIFSGRRGLMPGRRLKRGTGQTRIEKGWSMRNAWSQGAAVSRLPGEWDVGGKFPPSPAGLPGSHPPPLPIHRAPWRVPLLDAAAHGMPHDPRLIELAVLFPG
jgi:hypothetical protein